MPRFTAADFLNTQQALTDYVHVAQASRPSITDSVELYATEARIYMGCTPRSAQRWFDRLGLKRHMNYALALHQIQRYFGRGLTCSLTPAELAEDGASLDELRILRAASHLRALETYLSRIERCAKRRRILPRGPREEAP